MRTLILPMLTSCLLVLAPASVGAEEELVLPPVHVGVGTSLSADYSILNGTSTLTSRIPFNFANLSVPVLFDSGFKLEPGIGYLHYDLEAKGGGLESSLDIFRFDLGLFYTPALGKLLVSLGSRVGLAYTKDTTLEPLGSNDSTSLGLIIGPTLGAEYFLSQHFSIGAETQLVLSLSGLRKDDPYDLVSVSTRAQFTVRFYFTSAEPQVEPTAATPPAAPGAAEEAEAEREVPVAPPLQKEEEVQTETLKDPGVQTPPCPAGTQKVGQAPPAGGEQYCAVKSADGGWVKEGWLRTWYDSGQLASEGTYAKGLRDGSWTYFHGNGVKRLEAHYRKGEKRGSWTRWDRQGNKISQIDHAEGAELE